MIHSIRSIRRWLISGACAFVACTGSAAQSAQPLLPILVYHQIRVGANGPADGHEVISLQRFEEQMRYLHEQGYMTLSTDEAVEFVAGRASFDNQKVVAIHIDDGWKSGRHALPALERYGFRAVFWIIPGTGIGEPHMDWSEVEAIARNPRYEVLSHTLTHPWKKGETLLDWIDGRTPGRDVASIRHELVESRRLIEEKLQRPAPYLAWPSGLYNDRLVMLASEAGYRALFTIDGGANRPGGDVLRVNRTIVDGGCGLDTFAQMVADGRYRECTEVINAAHRPPAANGVDDALVPLARATGN